MFLRLVEKSTWLIERLNLDEEEKSTLEGKEFHTVMTLLEKNSRRMKLSDRNLYSL